MVFRLSLARSQRAHFSISTSLEPQVQTRNEDDANEKLNQNILYKSQQKRSIKTEQKKKTNEKNTTLLDITYESVVGVSIESNGFQPTHSTDAPNSREIAQVGVVVAAVASLCFFSALFSVRHVRLILLYLLLCFAHLLIFDAVLLAMSFPIFGIFLIRKMLRLTIRP